MIIALLRAARDFIHVVCDMTTPSIVFVEKCFGIKTSTTWLLFSLSRCRSCDMLPTTPLPTEPPSGSHIAVKVMLGYVGPLTILLMVLLLIVFTMIKWSRGIKAKRDEGNRQPFERRLRPPSLSINADPMDSTFEESGLVKNGNPRNNKPTVKIATLRNTLASRNDKCWEIPFSVVCLGEELGSGEFWTLHKAEIFDSVSTDESLIVTAKVLKGESTSLQRRRLLSEIALLQQLDYHPHLAQMLACCTRGVNVALVMEYYLHGNLKCFLQQHKHEYTHRQAGGLHLPNTRPLHYFAVDSAQSPVEDLVTYRMSPMCKSPVANGLTMSSVDLPTFSTPLPKVDPRRTEGNSTLAPTLLNQRPASWHAGTDESPTQELLRFAREIAQAMDYLSHENIIHRDLCARNILVSSSVTMKVAKYAFSRTRSTTEGAGLPMRWLPPEAIRSAQFTAASVVWSFGTVLWEIFTLGTSLPYPDLADDQLLAKLADGYRMPKPPSCPPQVYELMLLCWQGHPEYRPSFSKIVDEINASVSHPHSVACEQRQRPLQTSNMMTEV